MAARFDSSFNSVLEWASFHNLDDICDATRKAMAERNIKETVSETKLPFKEALDILELTAKEKFGPERPLARLLFLISEMHNAQKETLSDIQPSKWFAIKRLIINQIAICNMMNDFTVSLDTEDFFQIPPTFSYPDFKANLTRFFDEMKPNYLFEDGESEEHSIDVDSFTKNLITKTSQGNFFSKKRVLHLLQTYDHKKFCSDVTDFVKQVQNEQPAEVQVVLKYIMPHQDEVNGMTVKRQRV